MGKIVRDYSKPDASLSSTSESTKSTSITEIIDGSGQCKFSDYSLSKDIETGRYIESRAFMAGGYAWKLFFYPRGKWKKDKEYISIFIALASEVSVRGHFGLQLLDQSQSQLTDFKEMLKEDEPFMITYSHNICGINRFCKRTLLEQSGYLKDDCFFVHYRISVLKSRKICYSIAVPPSKIGQHFAQLLESGKRTDVKFEVNGETFSAHKLVLAARSPVFRAQLYGPMKDENTQCIKVEDIQPSVFKALLHFIYSNALPDMKEFTGMNSKRASTFMSQHLLAAADRYGLERLRLLCESNLCKDVAINTVATTLALAEQHHCFQLKAVCLKFVSTPENLRAVMHTNGFKYLRESCPAVVTELFEYAARVSEPSVLECKHGNEVILDDGTEVVNVRPRRQVKQRLAEASFVV
ncbi:BTB/POZ and MATH domain-containing protein [Melia azedarach]|uniref:BTB/POZ and MATH domain-containing protein n=1 Tax=Melia azedarach TaxID=155640 RepID=A0ACC1YXP6_MELAZ|nr:BTB/POZ and MATH domain-containing protein [Melia azedarach]